MTESRILHIEFHGRVIEHLGIDMYQSPVAAIAELISNAWDADATSVDIDLPKNIQTGAEIVIRDNGEGMTFNECQDRYLKVGYNRRKDRKSAVTNKNGRPVMGRKGIGKFAGFGIAGLVEVETVSEKTGEKTVFQLDVAKLTGEKDDYASSTPMPVSVVTYLPPDEDRKGDHGTKLTLRELTLKKTPNTEQFARSMARRFLLMDRADEFKVNVDGKSISDVEEVEKIEFDFPRDYKQGELPPNLTVKDGWGTEVLPDGNKIKWRFVFYKDTISDDDLAGISIFSHHKLSQRPFFFNLSGGIGGQQGMSYLSGRVEADFIDDQTQDLISTERQRISWQSETTLPLLNWGQSRVKSLLRRWQDRRAEVKVEAMNRRLTPFSTRLDKLDPPEKKIVRRALTAVARIAVLSDENFAHLADAILSAWEGGRLKGLIDKLSEASELDAEELVQILVESRVMNALHAAERVKAQLSLIEGLEERIRNRDLENAVRDYIAENPWMISPEWDTFRVEKSLSILTKEIAKESLDQGGENNGWNKRVDLLLSSGNQLLVVEFMRPGVTADWDHVSRFKRYVLTLRAAVLANRGGDFREVSGLMVADRIDRNPAVESEVDSLKIQGLQATDWNGLLFRSKKQWEEYFQILVDRAPEDERMQNLASTTSAPDDTQESDEE
ncbi:ATP-binding protein [Lentzea rhizosphaerae]|uniref:ATP-binding protein n=1 Tax=Lentzea rhizosphaerae TaxID=2041025 RepID=A0ABV8BQK3_9PSEU